MRSKVRLRVLIPFAVTVVVAIAGLAVLQLDLLDKVGLGSNDDLETPIAASAAGSGSPVALGDSALTEEASAEAPAESAGTEEVEAGSADGGGEPARPGGMEALEAELARHKLVVLVAYMPNSAVDLEVTRAARLAAGDVNAGFVSIDASKEKMIRDLATQYDLRETPAVLLFTPGPELGNKLTGYLDRTTVAQAAVEVRTHSR